MARVSSGKAAREHSRAIRAGLRFAGKHIGLPRMMPTHRQPSTPRCPSRVNFSPFFVAADIIFAFHVKISRFFVAASELRFFRRSLRSLPAGVTRRHQTPRGGRVFAQQIRQGRERWFSESRYQKCLGLQNLNLRSRLFLQKALLYLTQRNPMNLMRRC